MTVPCGPMALLEHRERDEAGGLTNLEEYAYQVDAEGNWVHRTMTRRHLPHSTEEMISTTERVIEYDDDRIAETGGGAGSIPTVLPRSNG